MSGAEPLCAQERETISRELSRGHSARRIGKQLGRHHSTLSNEINRHGGAAHYRAVAAQERYESLKARPKERKLVASSRLHDAVNEGLEQKWSPEQIRARLDEEYPDDPEMNVSHETMYQTLYLQAKGELRTELTLAPATGSSEASTPIPGDSEQGKDPRHGQHQ
jgi:transposase, IS30 family